MQILMKLRTLQAILLTLNFFFQTSIAQQSSLNSCRNVRPFFLQKSKHSVLLNRMLLCKSHKLYFRTSLGLFPISSIDYKRKLLTLSHKPFSSSSHFISPSNLSAGLPLPPQPNSLFLFNCSNPNNHLSPFLRNCTLMHGKNVSSCLVVDDIGNLDIDFHPKDLDCSHYSRVYKNVSIGGDMEGFQLGTRISFDIPDHVPNPCDECEKSHGNCGVGLRCACHPKDCRDKVISIGARIFPLGGLLYPLLFFVVMRELYKGS